MDSLCFSDENHTKFHVNRTIINEIASGYGNEIFMKFPSFLSELCRCWCHFNRRNIGNQLASFSQRSDEKC